MIVVVLVGCRTNTSEPAPQATALPTPTPVTNRGGDSAGDGSEPATALPPAIVNSATSESQRIIYSVPFEVQPDGFGFRNYGPGYPEGDFTIAELRELFGDGVCSRVDEESDLCVPTAEAQQWIADRNADMLAGHCIGFTVTSYRFAQGDMQPAEFAENAEAPYQIAQDVPIMRSIALHGSLYWVKSVWSSEVSGTPRDIIDALIALREPVDLSIFLPGLVGGHSLLAYGVEEVAPGQYRILVYDNNFPGQNAHVEVDYEANTWNYDHGAVNPDQIAIPYQGDATTETLRFIPLSSYDAATCPFCPADSETDTEDQEDSQAFTLISVLGQGEILAKTALGAIGQVAGEIINEIPGATLLFPRGQLAAFGPPGIVLPDGTDFSLEFTDIERVSGLGSNVAFTMDRLAPGRNANQLSVAADGQNVEFQAGGDQSPSLSVMIRQDGASYKATLLGVDFKDGQGLSLGAPASGQGLELRSQAIEVADATLLITRLTEEEEAIFATTNLSVEDGGGVTLDISEWDGRGDMVLLEDADGDGIYDDTPSELPNEPLDEVMQNSEAGDVENIIDTISPFMGQGSLESILAGLAEQDMTGHEIGELLRTLNLSDDQLVEFIPPLALPVPEVGELIHALRLQPERVETVANGLELPEDDEAELLAYLDNLELFQQILVEWAFLKTDDLDRLVELLLTYDLTSAQLALALPRLGLADSEIEYVLSGLELSMSDLEVVADQIGVDIPPTRTPTLTPTPSITGTITATVTARSTITGTLTLITTPTITVTASAVFLATPTGTPTTDAYPGAPPLPTGTPAPYPYPGELPPSTATPGAYPGGPTATPDYDSTAFCVGDDLRVVAEEPTWDEGTLIELWVADELLFSGEVGPDDEPLEIALAGPANWADIELVASEEPERVPLGTVSCPSGG